MAILKRSKSVIVGLNDDIANLQAADSANAAAVLAEQGRAEGEESRIEGLVTAETTRATGVEGTLTSLYTNDKTSLVGGINELYNAINLNSQDTASDLQNEIDRATAAEAQLSQDISDEEAARISADNTLQGNIDTVSGDLASEISARTSADADLQSQIDNIISNTDASALDSLSEIVSAFQNADSDLEATITNVLGTHTSELNAAVADLEAADATLQSNIDAGVVEAKNYADSQDLVLKGELETYADTAEADAISTSNSYTDGREVAITSAYVAADAVVLQDGKDYTDGKIATVNSTIDANKILPFTESVVVDGDNITLTKTAIGNTIMNFSTVRYIDSNSVSYDIPVTFVSGSTFLLHPDVSGDFNTKSVTVQYFYNPTV